MVVTRHITRNGRRFESLFPAMVMKADGSMTCRTVLKDDDGTLWCVIDKALCQIRRIDGSKLPAGKRAREAYEVVA